MAKPARSLKELPALEGWLTFGEAATMLGISVERVRQLATATRPKLTTAHQIGQRPIGIVREAEVRELVRQRREAREAAAAEVAAQDG